LVSLFPCGATKKQPRKDGHGEKILSSKNPVAWTKAQSGSFRYTGHLVPEDLDADTHFYLANRFFYLEKHKHNIVDLSFYYCVLSH